MLKSTYQGLKPNPKESLLELVLGGFSKIGTDIGTYISCFNEPEPEPELFKMKNKKFGFFKSLKLSKSFF